MGITGTKSASSEELFQKELELKHYEERLRLREVAISEREKRIDGELECYFPLINNYDDYLDDSARERILEEREHLLKQLKKL